MPKRRPVPADHAARMFAFARAYRLTFVGEFDPAREEIVSAMLERPGHYLMLFVGTDEDGSAPEQVVVFASRPLGGILGYETVSVDESTRRIGDLLRSGRVVKLHLAGGVLKSEVTRA